jgi:diguanylate cyclase (GGDEF)-like protein
MSATLFFMCSSLQVSFLIRASVADNQELHHSTVQDGLEHCRTDMGICSRVGFAYCNYRGDEFALLLPNTPRDAASKLFEKVLSLLTMTMQQKGWPVTFSIGAVTFLTAPESVANMIQRADETMYSVKQAGKNCIRQEEIAA